MIDVCNAQNFRDEKTILSRDIALTRPGKCSAHKTLLNVDTCIASQWWTTNIVLKINSYLTQCDSPYEHVRSRSEALIEQEVNLCMHLACSYIMIDMPRSDKIENFAATINRFMANPCTQQKFVIRLDIPDDTAEAEKLY